MTEVVTGYGHSNVYLHHMRKVESAIFANCTTNDEVSVSRTAFVCHLQVEEGW